MIRRLLWTFLAVGMVHSGAATTGGEPLNVSVAISLKESITEIGKAYTVETGREVKFTFGASGTLAAQIKNGAPVDAFISAAGKQVDELEAAEMVQNGSRRVLATNTLVLIVPGKGASAAVTEFKSLGDGKVKRVAIGDPKAVPAGEYARQSLKAMEVWDKLGDRIVYGENVRQVLDYVVRGEVDAGIVYATDSKEAGDKVKVVATADDKTHSAIEYPAVIVKDAKQPGEAAKFLDFVEGQKAKAILEARGFGVAPKKK